MAARKVAAAAEATAAATRKAAEKRATVDGETGGSEIGGKSHGGNNSGDGENGGWELQVAGQRKQRRLLLLARGGGGSGVGRQGTPAGLVALQTAIQQYMLPVLAAASSCLVLCDGGGRLSSALATVQLPVNLQLEYVPGQLAIWNCN